MERKVVEVIVEQLGVARDAVVPSARLADDLGADSLDLIEMALGFQETFDAELPENEVHRLRTVGDAMEYVGRSLQPSPAPSARRSEGL